MALSDQCGDHTQRVLDILSRFTSAFPQGRPSAVVQGQTRGDVILVTGTTGGLGCNILAHLCLDPHVKKIYALNRSSPHKGLEERQVEIFKQRGVLEDCLNHPKYQLVEARLSEPLLGLNTELYTEICESVTHIIHSAWSINLVKPLDNFEDCLQGTRNLIDLAVASPQLTIPKFVFVSSISAVRNYSGVSVPEEPIPDPSVCFGFGYSESKWVGEQIVYHASQSTGLRATSVRVGILCGDRNGHWNTSELYPSVVKSALELRYLPNTEDALLPWIPTFEAAGILCAMRNSEHPVLHLESPNPAVWSEVFGMLAKELGVSLMPDDVWLSLLQDYSNHGDLPKAERRARVPAIDFIPYLLDVDFSTYRYQGYPHVDTSKAVQVVPMLKDIRITEEMVTKWVNHWREIGFLPRKETLRAVRSKL